jgi:hypothetical protein
MNIAGPMLIGFVIRKQSLVGHDDGKVCTKNTMLICENNDAAFADLGLSHEEAVGLGHQTIEAYKEYDSFRPDDECETLTPEQYTITSEEVEQIKDNTLTWQRILNRATVVDGSDPKKAAQAIMNAMSAVEG